MTDSIDEKLDAKEHLDRGYLVRQDADFLACLCCTNKEREYLLILRCYPTHKSGIVWKDVRSRYDVIFQGHGTSKNSLCKGDEVFFSLPDGFTATSGEKHKETMSIK